MLHGDAGSEQFLSEMFNPPAFAARHLSMESHLRIRLARRRLAHAARVRTARPAADRVRRRHGARALPRGDAPRSSNSATRSPATAGAGSTTRTSTRPPSASTWRAAWQIIERLTGDAAAGLVHRPRQPEHAPPGGRLRRLRLRQRLLRRRPAVLAAGDARPTARWRRTWSCPTRWTPTTCASRCRRASTHGDHFFTYLRDAFDVLYAEGDERPTHDEHRHALPPARPARAHARAAALPRPCRSSTTGSGSAGASTSRGTGRRRIRSTPRTAFVWE